MIALRTIAGGAGESAQRRAEAVVEPAFVADLANDCSRYLTERFLAQRRHARLLDLGCGRGEFLHGFGRQAFDVVGFDRAPAVARAYTEPVVTGDCEKSGLPFANGSFGVVFTRSTLDRTENVSRWLAECLRVLEPGGRLIAMVPDWRAQWRHFYDDWRRVRPFTLTSLADCVTCHGFTLRVAERFRDLPVLWRRPYLEPLADLASLLPEAAKRWEPVRLAKERLLLVVADKPERPALRLV